MTNEQFLEFIKESLQDVLYRGANPNYVFHEIREAFYNLEFSLMLELATHDRYNS